LVEAVAVAYLAVLAGLAVFGVHRLHLVWLLLRHPSAPPPTPPPSDDGADWPVVTVQLPVYDEAAVVGRLLDAVARLDYPRERLEVQVLDDSSDETSRIAAERVAHHHARGLDVEHVRRGDRVGFKAGALAHGLERARGDLVAVFDADFVPPSDFLRRVVPRFGRDRQLGLVQACWGHLNRSASVLTRVQALALDAHFRVEQAARSRSGRFFNFNGTAGVWRREAIDSAGGWSADTITEDLDLSLRAQLCGWRFELAEDVEVPAELPEDLHAFRAQQRRWTRGSAQTARKLLGHVWRTPGVRLAARLEATFQLTLNAAYPLLLLLALLSVPLAAWGYPRFGYLVELQWTLFGLATGSVTLFYLVARRGRGPAALARAALVVPALYATGLGLSLCNAWAYVAGLLLGPTPFVRTPKAGGGPARYRARRSHLVWLEAGLTAYLAGGLAVAAADGHYVTVPFLALIGAGFGAMTLGGLSRRSPLRAGVAVTCEPTGAPLAPPRSAG